MKSKGPQRRENGRRKRMVRASVLSLFARSAKDYWLLWMIAGTDLSLRRCLAKSLPMQSKRNQIPFCRNSAGDRKFAQEAGQMSRGQTESHRLVRSFETASLSFQCQWCVLRRKPQTKKT